MNFLFIFFYAVGHIFPFKSLLNNTISTIFHIKFSEKNVAHCISCWCERAQKSPQFFRNDNRKKVKQKKG